MKNMLNQIILVGRLAQDPKTIELENGRKKAIITLAVPRNYKNENGMYDTDFIDCVLWNSIAENTTEYCRKGDLVGIKGRIETITSEEKKQLYAIAEKVTFLSSRKESEEV